MDDEQRSGSRWEPTEADTAGTGTATDELERPADVTAGYAAPVAASPPSWRARLRPLRSRAAAVAAAAFVLGGAGGFALGHTVGGGGVDRVGQQGQLRPGQRPDGFGNGFGPQDGQQDGQNGQQAPSRNGTQPGTTSGDTT